MKFELKALEKMSDAELAALNNSFTEQRDALQAEKQKIKAVLDKRAADTAAKRKIAAMSGVDREAMKRHLSN